MPPKAYSLSNDTTSPTQSIQGMPNSDSGLPLYSSNPVFKQSAASQEYFPLKHQPDVGGAAKTVGMWVARK